MKNIFLLVLFLNVINFSFSQEKEMNELYQELYSQPEKKYETIQKLREIYHGHSLDSVFSLANFAMQNGVKADDSALIYLSKIMLAYYYARSGNSEMSHGILDQCIIYYNRRNDLVSLADAQNIKGMAYLNMGNMPKAIEWFVKSVNTAKKLPEDNTSFQAQVNLAHAYFEEGQYDLAEAETLLLLDKVKKRNFVNQVRIRYDLLGKIYIAKGNKELGYSYFQKSLAIALKQKSKIAKSYSYNNIAIVYFEQEELELAYENFKKALDLRIEINMPIPISESYYNLGDWYYFQDKYKEAIPYYMKSKEIADSNNLLRESADAVYKMGLSYENMGQYKLASQYYSQYIDNLESLSEIKHSKQLDMQRIAYEMQRKEDQLNQTKREILLKVSNDKQRDRAKVIVIIFSILTSALLLLYLFTILKRNIESNKKKKVKEFVLLPSENEIDLINKWETLEGFIISDEQILIQKDSFLNDQVKFTSGMQVFELENGNLIFWETNSSKLESYVFNNFIISQINGIEELSNFAELINKQELIDVSRITFGMMCDHEDKFLVCGNNGLLIQNENKMSFMTENKLDVKEYSVFVSENLKNFLIENKLWEKFLKQIDMSSKMSSSMALTTIEDSWGGLFKTNQLGVFIIQPI